MTATIYGAVCVLAFVVVAALELIFVARAEQRLSDRRLLTNFGIAAASMAIALLIPIGSLSVAAFAEERGIGLLQRLAAPATITLTITYAARTLLAYCYHRAAHRLPWLWRCHRVHHTDHQIDISTALRSHPVEELIGLLIVAPTVLLLGPPAWAIGTVELTMFALALLGHANLRVPARWSRKLELVFVTPDFHLLHHSAERAECDSNYGDVFSLWDRLLGTYRAPGPVRRIGLGPRMDACADDVLRQLWLPMMSDARIEATARPVR